MYIQIQSRSQPVNPLYSSNSSIRNQRSIISLLSAVTDGIKLWLQNCVCEET